MHIFNVGEHHTLKLTVQHSEVVLQVRPRPTHTGGGDGEGGGGDGEGGGGEGEGGGGEGGGGDISGGEGEGGGGEGEGGGDSMGQAVPAPGMWA